MEAQDENKMATIHKILQTIEYTMDLSEGEVNTTDHLRDLYMDSLDRVEMVLLLERDLNVKYTDEEMWDFDTVQDVIDLTMVKILENYDRR